MLKTTLPAVAVFISVTSAASAQSGERQALSSTADVNYAVTGTPGTIGAMNLVVRGIATSPNDVALQQQGRHTSADGAQPLPNVQAETVGYSHGTVGATPGQ